MAKRTDAKSNLTVKETKLSKLREAKTLKEVYANRKEMQHELQKRHIAKEIVKPKTPLKHVVTEHNETLKNEVRATHILASKIVKDFIDVLDRFGYDAPTNVSLFETISGLKKRTQDYQAGRLTLGEYKAKSEKVLAKLEVPLTRKARTIVEHIHEAFRQFFNLLDRLLTPMVTLGKQKESKETLGARLLHGKDHFFNPLKSDIAILVEKFDKTLKKLDDTHATKEHGDKHAPKLLK